MPPTIDGHLYIQTSVHVCTCSLWYIFLAYLRVHSVHDRHWSCNGFMYTVATASAWPRYYSYFYTCTCINHTHDLLSFHRSKFRLNPY